LARDTAAAAAAGHSQTDSPALVKMKSADKVRLFFCLICILVYIQFANTQAEVNTNPCSVLNLTHVMPLSRIWKSFSNKRHAKLTTQRSSKWEQLKLRLREMHMSSKMNVIMIWSSGQSLQSRTQNVVLLSVIKSFSFARITIFSNNIEWQNNKHVQHAQTTGIDIKVVPIDFLQIATHTPLYNWYHKILLKGLQQFSDVHLSDLLRLVLLYKFGGLYTDFDSIWLKSITEPFLIAADASKFGPCSWCINETHYIPNGVLAVPRHSNLMYSTMLHISESEYDIYCWNCLGPKALTHAYMHAKSPAALVNEKFFLPFDGRYLGNYFYEVTNSSNIFASINTYAYAVHLYGAATTYARMDPSSVVSRLFNQHLNESCPCDHVVCAPSVITVPFSLSLGVHYMASFCITVYAANMHLRVQKGQVSLEGKRAKPSRMVHIPFGQSVRVTWIHTGHFCNDKLALTSNGSVLHYVTIKSPCVDKDATWKLNHTKQYILNASNVCTHKKIMTAISSCVNYPELRSFDTAFKLSTFKIGLLVFATGEYYSWLPGFIHSSERFLLPGHDLHYFIITDMVSITRSLFINTSVADRLHIYKQNVVGWPLDSLLRHHIYYKFRTEYSKFKLDFIFAVDPDVAFVSEIREEILGETVGVLQSFTFGKMDHGAFESDKKSSAFVPADKQKCYYAGGFFGGSVHGFIKILKHTMHSIEIDAFDTGVLAKCHDESHLNRYFSLYPPTTSLPANYIYPEPPFDYTYLLSDLDFLNVFPMKVLNLGGRKHLDRTTNAQRTSFTSNQVVNLHAVRSWYGAVDMDIETVISYKHLPSCEFARKSWQMLYPNLQTYCVHARKLQKYQSQAQHVLILQHDYLPRWLLSVEFLYNASKQLNMAIGVPDKSSSIQSALPIIFSKSYSLFEMSCAMESQSAEPLGALLLRKIDMVHVQEFMSRKLPIALCLHDREMFTSSASNRF